MQEYILCERCYVGAFVRCQYIGRHRLVSLFSQSRGSYVRRGHRGLLPRGRDDDVPGSKTSPMDLPHVFPSTVGRNSKVSMLASMHQSAVTIVGIVPRLWYILAKIYFPVGLGIQLDTFLYFTIILTLKYNTEMHLVAPMNKFNIPLQTQLVISRVDEGDERGDPRTEKGLPTGFVRVKGFEEIIM